MVVGPLMVWLVYAHFFRDFSVDREWRETVLVAMSVVAGTIGALALGSPFNRWPLLVKLIAFAAYGTALAFAIDLIALFAICTTGDCL